MAFAFKLEGVATLFLNSYQAYSWSGGFRRPSEKDRPFLAMIIVVGESNREYGCIFYRHTKE